MLGRSERARRGRGGTLGRLILCSRNEHKLAELRDAFPAGRSSALDADGYPPETGATYYENARGKALYGRPVAPADAWVVGEDSGIEVDALGGEPGVSSARWADAGSQHLALLDRLGDEPNRRSADDRARRRDRPRRP